MARIRLYILFVMFSCTVFARADGAKIVKVLPHYIDTEGRHALSPSLFDRDAYQAILRKSPDKCAGIRFDIQWKAKNPQNLKLKVEMRGSNDSGKQIRIIEGGLKKRGLFGHWTSLKIEGKEFKDLGQLLAWRVSLWDGDKMLSEQKSFLW